MKRYLLFAAALFVALTFAGCSQAKETKNRETKPDISTTTPSSPAPGIIGETHQQEQSTNNSTDNKVLEAYKAVLENKAEFISIDSNKKFYLNDYLISKEDYDITFKATNFTVLDMDGDKVPEIVLELTVSGEPQFYEVLHIMNDTVYGDLVTYRGLIELKADGTFSFSSGAADSGVGKMKFEPDAFKIDPLAYSESRQGDSDLIIEYFIDDKPVSKEAFDAFIIEQSGKKDTVWHEFSQKNIETELSEKT